MSNNRVGFNIEVNGHKIYGYSRYISIYNQMVNYFPDNALFVEVGSFLGQSAAAMGHFIKESQKTIWFDAIDLFELSEFSDEEHFDVVKEHGGDFMAAFNHNIEKAGVSKYVRPKQSSSVEAAAGYANRSIDMVMIDASHETKDVIDDIEAWMPKVKVGGFILFDDMDWPEVSKAVYSKINGKDLQVSGSTGIYRKEHP